MVYSNQYGAYQKAGETVSEMQQLIMLYDGTINFVEQAKDAIENNDPEGRYNKFNKAIAIIAGLNSCLDFNEQTHDTATALDEYYRDLDMRMLYAQASSNLEDCNKIVEDLKTMRDAWVDVAKQTSESRGVEKEVESEINQAVESAAVIINDNPDGTIEVEIDA